jgi:hypothetical protein
MNYKNIVVTIQRKKMKKSKKRLDRVFLGKSENQLCMSALDISDIGVSESAV